MRNVFFLFIFLSLSVQAETTPSLMNIAPSTNDSGLYYEIGGGQTISTGATNSPTTIAIGGSISWGFNASCGNFDFGTSIGNFMNNISNGAETAMKKMVAAASGVVSSLPGLILQRANPGLYDLMQNGLLRAEEAFNIAIKSCEEMEADIAAGKNPFEGFATVSKKNFWAKQKASGGDAIGAKKAADNNGKHNGFPWVGGTYAAGSSSTPANVISDVSKAGYNLALGRAANDSTTTTNGRMTEVFNSPGDMQTFAVSVLGDVEIKTCDGCEMVRTTPGKGLLPVLTKDTEFLQTELAKLVTASKTPTYAELTTVSANGLRITPEIITSLREEKIGMQSILIGKLGNDIALARTLEKALFLRRALETGKREPNVSANGEALNVVKDSVSELNAEIESLVFDMNIRKNISRSTVRMILARQDQRDNHITGTHRTTNQENLIIDGTVRN